MDFKEERMMWKYSIKSFCSREKVSKETSVAQIFYSMLRNLQHKIPNTFICVCLMLNMYRCNNENVLING